MKIKNNIKNNKVKFVLWGWSLIGAFILIALIISFVFGNDISNSMANKYANELMQNDGMLGQLTEWRARNYSDKQIVDMLKNSLLSQGNNCNVQVIKDSLSRAMVFWVLVFIGFLIVFKTNITKNSKLQICIVLGFLAIIDNGIVARKYIQVDNTNNRIPTAVQKVADIPMPFRIAAYGQEYNSWILSSFVFAKLECINVSSVSRTSLAQQALFYSNFPLPRLWKYGNVRFVYGEKSWLQNFLSIPGTKVFLNFQAPFSTPQLVLELTDSLPRIFAVGSWLNVTNVQQATTLMADDNLDPLKFAIVSDRESITNSDFKAEVKSEPYVREKLTAKVNLSHDGLVIMASDSHKGWRAYLDGEPAKIINCNLMHQGIMVPAGEHTIVFEFNLNTGLAKLSNTMILLIPIFLIGNLAWLFYKRKNKK